jgi:nitrate reductase NapAB chaperone NapD
MNGLFADTLRYAHVLIPDDINPSVATVVRSGEGYTVVVSEAKKQEKLQQGWEELRKLRNDKLAAIDYMFLTDYSISDQDKEQWRAYRQALRDLPSTLTDEAILHPETIAWPVKPQ